MAQENQKDIMFVRHAQSYQNEATELYVARHNLVYDWEHLSKDKRYLFEVKYSDHLIDCSITPLGQQQCQGAKEKASGFNPDIILVSPLNRALETCSRVFPNPSCSVVVEPILAEGLRSACDFSCDFEQKLGVYPNYNFEKVQSAGKFWFIKNESEENQAKYRSIIDKNKGKSYDEIIKVILDDLLETWTYETPTNLRRRTQRLKKLLSDYRKTYKKIAIVTHYNIIRFSLAKQFNAHDEPYHCHIDNCAVLPVQLKHL